MKLIIANWKMNPQTMRAATRIFKSTEAVASKLKKIKTIICPPFVYLSNLQSSSQNKLVLGAQDIFWTDKKTSYTGEISAPMLKELGAKYVIIGHSERRTHLGETDEIINKKIKYALASGMKAIFCIGERERDKEGDYLNFIKKEILHGLSGVPKKLFKNLIIAYEPIWAIGKSSKNADTPENVFTMVIYIKRILVSIAGRDIADNIPILYGGSVDTKNTAGYLEKGKVDGLLIGHKSLIPKEFNEILKIADKC